MSVYWLTLGRALERRASDAEAILTSLAEEFPGNPMLRADLLSLRARP